MTTMMRFLPFFLYSASSYTTNSFPSSVVSSSSRPTLPLQPSEPASASPSSVGWSSSTSCTTIRTLAAHEDCSSSSSSFDHALRHQTEQLLLTSDTTSSLSSSSSAPYTTAAVSTADDVIQLQCSWAKLGTVQGAETVERLLRLVEQRYPSSLTSRHYAIAMDAWGKLGRVEAAEEIFRQQLQHLVIPDRNCYHTLLYFNSRAGRLDRCLEILTQMETSYPSSSSSSILSSSSSSSSSSLTPVTADYNLVLAAYVKHGKAAAAESLLKRMVDRCKLQEEFNNNNNDVNHNYEKSRIGAIVTSTATTASDSSFSQTAPSFHHHHHYQEESLSSTTATTTTATCLPWDCAPDLLSYNLVLDAHARSGKPSAGSRALSILREMQSSHNRGELSFRPDARTYSAVMQAVIRSSNSNSGRRSSNENSNPLPMVQSLLDEAKESGVHMDSYLYTILLDALATYHEYSEDDHSAATTTTTRERRRDAADKAEELLEEMEREGLANDVAYNTVLKVYKNLQHRRPDAPERAEGILRRMEERKCVDTISYTTMAGIYANVGDNESAHRAQDLLLRMQQAYENDGREAVKPNVQTFNSVLNAWVRCGRMQRAEQLLTQMEAYRNEGKDDFAPNVISYSTVMSGWAKSLDKNALTKTEATFNRMIAMYESGNQAAAPNSFSYVTLITAYARSRDNPEAAQKAQDLLMELYNKYRKGNYEMKPNAQLVSFVIDGWQKSGRRDAGEKAEALLNWTLEVWKTDQDDDFCPNEYAFGSTIAAWGKSRKMGKAVQARRVLHRMIQMYESGQLLACPNTHCFTAVINSCAYCENDPMEKRNALNIAISTFKDLAASKYGDPNEVTYSTILTALRNLLPQGKERSLAVQTVFKSAAQQGLVDDLVLRRVHSALTTGELKQLLVPVADNGHVIMEQVPRAWLRNLSRRR